MIKNKTVIFIFIIFIAFPLQAQEKGIQAIQTNEIKQYLYFLASDEMMGRDTPSPELDSCAQYIANEFFKFGLKPVGDQDSYFQYFNVLKSHLSQPNSFKLITGSQESDYEIKQDFVPLYFSANRSISAPVVFAGYGITAPEYDYDDYQNIDVQGKIVFVFTHEPQEDDSSSVFDGEQMTDHGKLITKAINARDHGAIGMIVVTDPNHRFRRPPNTWPSLMRHAPEDAIPLTLEEKMENKIVTIRIGKILAQDLLINTGKSMSGLHAMIDSTLLPQSFEIPNKTVTMTATLDFDRMVTQNVVGLLEGIDPQLKNQVMVIGGHYDHLGAPNDSTIFNGADDNASGTVGVMTIAKAFSQNDELPKRSVLFCTWAGEEKGLFGSRYYVDNAPIFPLENTVVNINMDMIGRNDSNSVEISGIQTCAEFQTIVEIANEDIGIHIKPEKRISRTDHVPFYRKKIPVLGFFTGLHSDYHKVTDDADKIQYDGMTQILKLTFKIAWELSNYNERPLFSNSELK